MERDVLCSQNMPVTFSWRLTIAAKATYQLGLRKTTMFTAPPQGFGFFLLCSYPFPGLACYVPKVLSEDSPCQADKEPGSPRLVAQLSEVKNRPCVSIQWGEPLWKACPLSLIVFVGGRGSAGAGGGTAIPGAEDEESKFLCSTSCFRKREKKPTMITCSAVRGNYVRVQH